MNKFLTIICLSLLSAPIMFADNEEAAPTARTKNKSSEESSKITVKNKSSFEAEAGTRNPFWPIGFKPKARIGGSGDSEGEVPPTAFLVSTITLDTATHFAII